MALQLVELRPPVPEQPSVDTRLDRIVTAMPTCSADPVEARVLAGFTRLLLIAETSDAEPMADALLTTAIELDDIAAGRLIGDERTHAKTLAGSHSARYAPVDRVHDLITAR